MNCEEIIDDGYNLKGYKARIHGKIRSLECKLSVGCNPDNSTLFYFLLPLFDFCCSQLIIS